MIAACAACQQPADSGGRRRTRHPDQSAAALANRTQPLALLRRILFAPFALDAAATSDGNEKPGQLRASAPK
jgi:hypothetical protein